MEGVNKKGSQRKESVGRLAVSYNVGLCRESGDYWGPVCRRETQSDFYLRTVILAPSGGWTGGQRGSRVPVGQRWWWNEGRGGWPGMHFGGDPVGDGLEEGVRSEGLARRVPR